jgi:rhodanese-related sulfurtransferase
MSTTRTATPPRTVDELLEAARARYRRIGPHEAAGELRAGVLVVDTRPAALRSRDGEIPGATVVERNVLEWRLDPQSPHRLPAVARAGQRVIVLCDEGYASSLAAATLLDLGLDATDVDGGFQAWRRAGLPVVR